MLCKYFYKSLYYTSQICHFCVSITTCQKIRITRCFRPTMDSRADTTVRTVPTSKGQQKRLRKTPDQIHMSTGNSIHTHLKDRKLRVKKPRHIYDITFSFEVVSHPVQIQNIDGDARSKALVFDQYSKIEREVNWLLKPKKAVGTY